MALGPNPGPPPVGPRPGPPPVGPPPVGPGRTSDMNMLSAAGGASPSGQGWLADVAHRNSAAISGSGGSWYGGGGSYSFTGGASMSPIIAELRGIRGELHEDTYIQRNIAASLSGGRLPPGLPPGAIGPNALPMHAGGGGAIFGGFGGGGGGGGYGGGGGGRGRGGGGYYGQGTGAFGGGFAGAASQLLSRSPLGLAAEVGAAAFFLPEEISGLANAEFGKSKQAIDFIRSTSRMGNVGGFAGADLRREFGYGGSGVGGNFDAIPGWMKQYGVTPDDAVASVQRFGIAPTTMGQAVGIAGRLAELPFRPDLSGLSAGELQSGAATQARYGRITPDAEGIVKFAQQIEPIFARATQMGVDQSALFRSINTYFVGNAARGGSADIPSIGKFLTGFSNVPGGGTGEFGLSMAAGVGGAGSLIGRAPLQTILSSSVTSTFKNEGDIKNWLNKVEPGFYDRLKSNPAESVRLDAVVKSIQQGDLYNANTLLGQILTGPDKEHPSAPGAITAMMSTLPTAGLSPAGALIATGNATGMGTLGVASQQAQTQQNAVISSSGGKGSALASRLMKDLGLTASGAAALVGNLMQESGLDPNSRNSSSGASGYANWLGPRKVAFEAFKRAHPELSPDEANTQFLEQEIKQGQYSGVLDALRDPNSTLQQQVLAVRKKYEAPGEAEANDARRMANASSVLTGRAGPRTAAEAVNEPELNKALTTNTVLGGIIPLRASGDVMSRNYEAASAAMRAAAAALDALRQGAAAVGSSSSTMTPY
jgi:hypothetical protein